MNRALLCRLKGESECGLLFTHRFLFSLRKLDPVYREIREREGNQVKSIKKPVNTLLLRYQGTCMLLIGLFQSRLEVPLGKLASSSLLLGAFQEKMQ